MVRKVCAAAFGALLVVASCLAWRYIDRGVSRRADQREYLQAALLGARRGLWEYASRHGGRTPTYDECRAEFGDASTASPAAIDVILELLGDLRVRYLLPNRAINELSGDEPLLLVLGKGASGRTVALVTARGEFLYFEERR